MELGRLGIGGVFLHFLSRWEESDAMAVGDLIETRNFLVRVFTSFKIKPRWHLLPSENACFGPFFCKQARGKVVTQVIKTNLVFMARSIRDSSISVACVELAHYFREPLAKAS